MDFTALKRFVSPLRPTDSEIPAPFRRPPPAKTRTATIRVIKQLLDALPGPGEVTLCILASRVDWCDYLSAILRQRGPAEHVRISTLSYAARNVRILTDWTTGAARKLTVVSSRFFRTHNPELHAALAAVLQRPHLLAAPRNHTKIATLDFGNGGKLVCSGSPNLRCNGAPEQVSIADDAESHDFHAAFIDQLAQGNDHADRR
jgi:hypothetical protein